MNNAVIGYYKTNGEPVPTKTPFFAIRQIPDDIAFHPACSDVARLKREENVQVEIDYLGSRQYINVPIRDVTFTDEFKVMDCQEVFVTPEGNNPIDFMHPLTRCSLYTGDTLEEMRERHPSAEIKSYREWIKERGERCNPPITLKETTEETWFYMLNVLPPIGLDDDCFLVGEPLDHFSKTGEPRYEGCFKRGGKYYVGSRAMTTREFVELKKTL